MITGLESQFYKSHSMKVVSFFLLISRVLKSRPLPHCDQVGLRRGLSALELAEVINTDNANGRQKKKKNALLDCTPPENLWSEKSEVLKLP